MASRTRLEDALAWIDVQVAALGAEDILVAEAVGRILAEDVQAERDVPPFDRAAVDGIAVRADETIGASAYNPLLFRSAAAAGDLPAGSAVHLDAGGRLPRGADAIVPLDHVGSDAGGACSVIEPVVAGNEVERAGSHTARGSTLAGAGRQLRPGDIGLLAAAGRARVGVVRRPRVRCLLVGIGAGMPGQVCDADGPLLRALVGRDGGVLIEQRSAGRDRAAIRKELELPGADIALVAGGTGCGLNDHAAAALAEAGELAVRGVALRPGTTAGIGRTAAGVPVFLLPGAPAACLWAYEFFAGRAIRRLGGRNPAFPFASKKMTAARKIVSEIGMTEVCPVRCSSEGWAGPIASFAAAGLKAASEADGFVLVPEGSEGYREGAAVTVYVFDEWDHARS